MPPQRNIMRENPPTVIANDGTTVLRRYRVDGVIYARNVQEARSQLRRHTYPGVLDDALIMPPSKQAKR